MLAFLGVAFLEVTARGDDELATAQLTYVANSDAAERCPDEESFRQPTKSKTSPVEITPLSKSIARLPSNTPSAPNVSLEAPRAGGLAAGC